MQTKRIFETTVSKSPSKAAASGRPPCNLRRPKRISPATSRNLNPPSDTRVRPVVAKVQNVCGSDAASVSDEKEQERDESADPKHAAKTSRMTSSRHHPRHLWRMKVQSAATSFSGADGETGSGKSIPSNCDRDGKWLSALARVSR